VCPQYETAKGAKTGQRCLPCCQVVTVLLPGGRAGRCIAESGKTPARHQWYEPVSCIRVVQVHVCNIHTGRPLDSHWQSIRRYGSHKVLTDLIEVMNDLQTEHYHALLVFKTSQVPMHPHIYTNPPICPPLCHLQIASSALPGSYSHMMAWVLQQRRVADHCNAHGESAMYIVKETRRSLFHV